MTHRGQYSFRKVPFGLYNSPFAFQKFVNCIFRPFLNIKNALVHFDDVIVLASHKQEALDNLEAVLSIASEYGRDINKRKCDLLTKRVQFLGQVIDQCRIYPSPEKVRAALNFPIPESVKDIQSILGRTGFFRNTIR